MIKAIIFDFDNVIGDSEKNHFNVLQSAAKKNGVIIKDEAFRIKVGKTSRRFLEAVLSDDEKQYMDKILQVNEEYKRNITQYVPPINITVDFIKNYHGPLLFAIASLSERRVIETLLKHYGIYEKFALIVSKEDVVHHKPDPEIYLKTAEKLHINPSECVVIEDAAVGAMSAYTAQMKCYILLNNFNQKEEFSHLTIGGFITSQKDLEKIALL